MNTQRSEPILRTARSARGSARRGFTLIEVMLVLAIIAVMMTIMVPQVMSSLREHQLRAATRVVISAGRHAMSLAVLSQRRMTVVYDLDESTLTIRSADAAEPEEPLDDALDGVWGPDEANATDEDDGAYAGAVAIVDEEVVHRLDGISFSFIELEGEDGYRAESGTHTIIYYANGRCTPYTIGFEDEDGAHATIEVDALASARVLKD